MLSALAPTSDITQYGQHVRSVPNCRLMHRNKASHLRNDRANLGIVGHQEGLVS